MSTTTTSPLPTGTWNADAIHSSVAFKVRHMGTGTYRSSFDQLTASYDGDAGTLTGTVPVESIDIHQPEQFRGHVLSPDFFDVANHADITFTTGDLRRTEGESIEVTGDLTINGITKSVTATGLATEPGIDMQGGQRFGVELSATVNRRDFGVTWGMELPNGKNALDDDVTLEVALEFVAEA